MGRARSKASVVEVPEEEQATPPIRETLQENVREIKRLDFQVCAGFWKIGFILNYIKNDSKMMNGRFRSVIKDKYGTFEEFCKAELGYSSGTVYAFMRVTRLPEEKVQLLGWKKAERLLRAGIPDDVRRGLAKDALPVEKGGRGLTLKELDEEIKSRGASTPAVRRKHSPFMKFKGMKFEGRESLDISKPLGKLENGTAIVKLDDFMGIEVVVDRPSVRVEFIELEDE